MSKISSLNYCALVTSSFVWDNKPLRCLSFFLSYFVFSHSYFILYLEVVRIILVILVNLLTEKGNRVSDEEMGHMSGQQSIYTCQRDEMVSFD